MDIHLPHNVKMMTNETVTYFPHDYFMKWLVLPLVPQWVKPNHITAFRFLATPIVLWLLAASNYRWGIPAFLIAALSDALDGSLARVRKQITVWGTFFDPVADKVLVGSVIILIVFEHINVWFGLFILFVELLIAGGALYRQWRGLPIVAANLYGKTKMVLQVIAVLFLLIALASGINLFIPFSIGTFSLAIVCAILSLFTYGL